MLKCKNIKNVVRSYESSSKESEKRLPRSKLEYATIAQDFETVLCVAYHHYPGFFVRAGLFESQLTLTQG